MIPCSETFNIYTSLPVQCNFDAICDGDSACILKILKALGSG